MPRWRFRHKQTGHERLTSLVAQWRVMGDEMSDNYTPAEISAEDLLAKWVNCLRPPSDRDIIPISWFVSGDETFEMMPFQYIQGFGRPPDFLTHFEWPTDEKTGARLN